LPLSEIRLRVFGFQVAAESISLVHTLLLAHVDKGVGMGLAKRVANRKTLRIRGQFSFSISVSLS
jgi:hypothetical protein